MTDEPMVLVESDRTRTVGRLDVATGKAKSTYEPCVQFDPAAPTVSVGGGEPPKAGEIRLTGDGSVSRGLLSATDGRARLELRDRNDRPTVTVTADGGGQDHAIRLFSGGREATRLETTSEGVHLVVLDAVGEQPLVEGRVDPPSITGQSGRLAVNDRTGFPSCRLLGRDGALVLTGREEETDRSSAKALYGADAFGGGELVVRTNDAVDDSVIGASDVDDVHVHAKGERDSDYGADADNRPRIALDGPEATIELGRARIDDDRPGVNGEIRVRGEGGELLLEAGTESRLTDEYGGELALRRSSGGAAEHVGSIVAHEDGLMIRFSRDAANRDFPTALLVTKRGEIKLSGSLHTDGV